MGWDYRHKSRSHPGLSRLMWLVFTLNKVNLVLKPAPKVNCLISVTIILIINIILFERKIAIRFGEINLGDDL
jgi:hypothetical protein